MLPIRWCLVPSLEGKRGELVQRMLDSVQAAEMIVRSRGLDELTPRAVINAWPAITAGMRDMMEASRGEFDRARDIDRVSPRILGLRAETNDPVRADPRLVRAGELLTEASRHLMEAREVAQAANDYPRNTRTGSYARTMARSFPSSQMQQIDQAVYGTAHTTWLAGHLLRQTLADNDEYARGPDGERARMDVYGAWETRWQQLEWRLATELVHRPEPREGRIPPPQHPEMSLRDSARWMAEYYAEPVQGQAQVLRTRAGMDGIIALSQTSMRMLDHLHGRELLQTTPGQDLSNLYNGLAEVEKMAETGRLLVAPNAVGIGQPVSQSSPETLVTEMRRHSNLFTDLGGRSQRALEGAHPNGGHTAETAMHVVWALGQVTEAVTRNLRSLSNNPNLVAFHSKLHNHVRTPVMDLHTAERRAPLPAHGELRSQMSRLADRIDERDGRLNAELVGSIRPIAGEQRWYQRALAEGMDRNAARTPSATRLALAITRASGQQRSAHETPRSSDARTVASPQL